MSVPTFSAINSQYVTPVAQRLGRLTLLVLCLWAVTLWWGERAVFKASVAACEWQNWESWPTDAVPHHVLFVADPQLVDPHTYPGRPWPLSTLTVLYTDLYLRRTYKLLLDHTQPHSTLFLGDLFDGGREWAAADYESPEDRYKKYGTGFWLREYRRFMKMFVDTWYENKWSGYLTGEGRKIICSLPGNHDLGFASGINEHVRNRFEAHFGPSNRIDILGNHSFVSLDTVSLSAMDQVDPATGAFGVGDGTGQDNKHVAIWKPAENFLKNAKNQRAKAVNLRYQHFQSLSTTKPSSQQEAPASSSSFPTIVLSHVPLFRNQDVTCGPYRERGDAIPLTAGYQYQNVLTPAISKDIVDHLDAEQITMIYSGDDHDYCEVEHGEYTGRIKEITVKSISWAMGVRKPGVQLASLWNPINMDSTAQGQSSTTTPRDTVQNHLCLLPDQLSIFIRYVQVLGLSVIILLIQAAVYKGPQQLPTSSPTSKEKSEPLLPLSRKHTPPSSPQITAVTNTTSTPTHMHNARARSNGKLSTYGNLPPSSRSTSTSPSPSPISKLDRANDTDDWGMPRLSSPSSSTFNRSTASVTQRLWHDLTTPAQTKTGEFGRSLVLVAGPVLGFYTWLLWNG